jgi:hypothetical protein
MKPTTTSSLDRSAIRRASSISCSARSSGLSTPKGIPSKYLREIFSFRLTPRHRVLKRQRRTVGNFLHLQGVLARFIDTLRIVLGRPREPPRLAVRSVLRGDGRADCNHTRGRGRSTTSRRCWGIYAPGVVQGATGRGVHEVSDTKFETLVSHLVETSAGP